MLRQDNFNTQEIIYLNKKDIIFLKIENENEKLNGIKHSSSISLIWPTLQGMASCSSPSLSAKSQNSSKSTLLKRKMLRTLPRSPGSPMLLLLLSPSLSASHSCPRLNNLDILDLQNASSTSPGRSCHTQGRSLAWWTCQFWPWVYLALSCKNLSYSKSFRTSYYWVQFDLFSTKESHHLGFEFWFQS